MFPSTWMILTIYLGVGLVSAIGLASFLLAWLVKPRLIWAVLSFVAFAELTAYALVFGNLGDIDLWWPVFALAAVLCLVPLVNSIRSAEASHYSIRAWLWLVFAICVLTGILFVWLVGML